MDTPSIIITASEHCQETKQKVCSGQVPHPGHGEESGTDPFASWTLNDPPRYPLSSPGEGSPWPGLLAKQKTYDKERCGGWKDEIDKILLFAALFSAIVTAFTIESTKRLEVDHQESAAKLLFAIHQQLDSMVRQNTSTLPSLLPDPSSTFQAAPYAVHVNICWYLSLTLSLTTTAVGILCLQWLREHEREPVGSPSMGLFSFRALRIESLDLWKVSAIVGSLPVLLLIALMLFFAGMIQSLWQSDRTVAIFISIAVGATVAAVLVATLLPAVTRRCVFRSPQFWPLYYISRVLVGALVTVIVPLAAVLLAALALVVAAVTLSKVNLCDYLEDPLFDLIEWAFRPFVRDWVEDDQAFVEDTGYLGFGLYTTIFAQDEEAILSLVRSAEEAILDKSEDKRNRIRLREMYLFARRTQDLYDWNEMSYRSSDFDDSLLSERKCPSELDNNVGEALCIQGTFTWSDKSGSEVILNTRYCELLIKIFNAYSVDLNRVFGLLVDGLGHRRDALLNTMHHLPDDVRNDLYDQISHQIYMTIDGRETYVFGANGPPNAFKLILCWKSLLVQRLDQTIPLPAIDVLNQRLRTALTKATTSSSTALSRVMVANVGWYLSCWYNLISGIDIRRGNNGFRYHLGIRTTQISDQYHNGESYRALAEAVWAGLGKYQGLREEIRGESFHLFLFMGALEQWFASSPNPNWQELRSHLHGASFHNIEI